MTVEKISTIYINYYAIMNIITTCCQEDESPHGVKVNLPMNAIGVIISYNYHLCGFYQLDYV